MNSAPHGDEAALDRLLGATLAANRLAPTLSTAGVQSLQARAAEQDVDVLLASIICGTENQVPAGLREQAMATIAAAELRALLRYRELCRLSAAFAAQSVDVILLKGSGLAYTIYPHPHLRPARDIDLFIARESRDGAERALAGCGYVRMREPDGEVAVAQRHYVRRDGNGINHFVDLHWRISNARAFAGALTFEEAWMSSILVPEVTPGARTLRVADALLLGCIHRVAHHQDGIDLLWLWDIHLLARRLPADEWDQLGDRAERTGVRAVCGRGLELARGLFDSPVPQTVLDRLATREHAEPTAAFVGGTLREIDVLRADLRATAAWRQRGTLLAEHLFPAPAYMRSIYGPRGRLGLLFAYAERLGRGRRRWFLPRRSERRSTREPAAGSVRR